MSTMQGAIFGPIVTTVLLATACSKGEPIPMAFVGTWQSDETLTLASMSESELVTPEDRERFSLAAQEARQTREREKFLAIVCTDNPYAAVWQPEEGTCEQFAAAHGS